jgi:hypothetical protein
MPHEKDEHIHKGELLKAGEREKAPGRRFSDHARWFYAVVMGHPTFDQANG